MKKNTQEHGMTRQQAKKERGLTTQRITRGWEKGAKNSWS